LFAIIKDPKSFNLVEIIISFPKGMALEEKRPYRNRDGKVGRKKGVRKTVAKIAGTANWRPIRFSDYKFFRKNSTVRRMACSKYGETWW
jgi:hypothetical protein